MMVPESIEPKHHKLKPDTMGSKSKSFLILNSIFPHTIYHHDTMLTYSVHVLKVTQGILYNILLDTYIDLPDNCFSLDLATCQHNT